MSDAKVPDAKVPDAKVADAEVPMPSSAWSLAVTSSAASLPSTLTTSSGSQRNRVSRHKGVRPQGNECLRDGVRASLSEIRPVDDVFRHRTGVTPQCSDRLT
jgi:hypothetical protein